MPGYLVYPLPTSANSISVTPVGNVAATDVQSAILEIDSEKAAVATYHTDSQNVLAQRMFG